MKKTVLILLGVLVALGLGGAVYESYAQARDARLFPPPGTLIDVGGRRLHLLCIGTGSPTVIFEASGFCNSVSSSVARLALAKQTRVCSYDRAGVGWSDPGPTTASAGMLAEDLRLLQDQASLSPPFVIVTSSIGGLVTEMFARRYPERVAGLVFADAANSEMLPAAASLLDSMQTRVRAACAVSAFAGRIGLVRALDPFGMRSEHSDAAEASAALMYRAQPWVRLCAVVRGAPATLQEFASVPPLRPDVPLVVLTAENSAGLIPDGLAWLVPGAATAVVPLLKETHQRLAQRSTRGTWRMVAGSGHLIASDRPQAVVDAARDVLAQVREICGPERATLQSLKP